MNKTLLNAICMLLFITSCNNISSEKKNDQPSDNVSSNDITKENDIKKDDITSNDEASKKIFSIKEGEVYINCKYINDNNLSTSKKTFDIGKITEHDVKSMIAIDKNLSVYFSKVIKSNDAKSFYYSSSDFFPCSAIIYVEHAGEMISLYLFQFNDDGKFINKFTLSEEIFMPDGINKQTSEIVNKDTLNLEVTLVKGFLDEYIDQNNYSEIIDSIVSKYGLEEGKLRLKSKDSTRQKVEVKQ